MQFNPSVQTLDLGNVSIRAWGPEPDRLPLADNLLVNTLLKPGNNTINVRAVANQTSIATYVLKPKYHCGVIPATITGNNVTYDGKILPWYTAALKAAEIPTVLNVSKTLTDAGYGEFLELVYPGMLLTMIRLDSGRMFMITGEIEHS